MLIVIFSDVSQISKAVCLEMWWSSAALVMGMWAWCVSGCIQLLIVTASTECIYISVNSQNYQNQSNHHIVEFVLKSSTECIQISKIPKTGQPNHHTDIIVEFVLKNGTECTEILKITTTSQSNYQIDITDWIHIIKWVLDIYNEHLVQ